MEDGMEIDFNLAATSKNQVNSNQIDSTKEVNSNKVIEEKKPTNVPIVSPSNLHVDIHEVWFLILHLLMEYQLTSCAKILEQELIENNLLLQGHDWKGGLQKRSYEELASTFSHIRKDHLKLLLDKLLVLSHQNNLSLPPGMSSLLGEDSTSLIHPNEKTLGIQESLVFQSSKPQKVNYAHLLPSMQLGIRPKQWYSPLPSVYQKFQTLLICQGHTSNPVYSAIFDKTGHRFITGSDDRLVKVWSTYNGLLIRTLRGHNGDILDLDINLSNTLLVSASNDNSIRLWDLNTYVALNVLQNERTLSTVRFLSTGYLLSTDMSGYCRLWKESDLTKKIVTESNLLFDKGESKLSITSVTKGGTLFANSGDPSIRVWSVSKGSLLSLLEGHTSKVTSLHWSNSGCKLLSGGDWTVRIWEPISKDAPWKQTILTLSEDKGSRCTMVLWSLDDRYIIGAAFVIKTVEKDYCISILKVWDAHTLQLVHVLNGHNGKIFALESHPKDSRIILSGGYDGVIYIWNIISGESLQRFSQFNVFFLDAKFSPNGSFFVASNDEGQFMLCGTESKDFYKDAKKEQYFQTDYRGIRYLTSGVALDELTQLEPHEIEPGLLTNSAGIPYDDQPNFRFSVVESTDESQQEALKIKAITEMEEQVLEKYFAAKVVLPLSPKPPQKEKKKRKKREKKEEEKEEKEEPKEVIVEEPEEDNDLSDEFYEGPSENESDDEIFSSGEEEDPNNLRNSSDEEMILTRNAAKSRKRRARRSRPLRRSKRRKLRSDHTYEDYSESDFDDSKMEVEDDEKEEKKNVKKSRQRKKQGYPLSYADWLKYTHPDQLHNCYCPQILDTILYFKKGHQQYLKQYPEDPPSEDLQLADFEKCQIIDMVYRVDSPTYCTLTLQLLEPKTEVNTFKVNYHVDTTFSDFIVLASKVEASLNREWKQGTKLKMYYQDSGWFSGTVVEFTPESGIWDSLNIQWDTSDFQRISPWEVEPLDEPPKLERETINPDTKRRVLILLKRVAKLKLSQNFVNPVSVVTYPTYLKFVPYPMDLSTLIQRLENDYYRRFEALRYDAGLILKNACKFNKASSDIVKEAKSLNLLLNDILDGKQINFSQMEENFQGIENEYDRIESPQKTEDLPIKSQKGSLKLKIKLSPSKQVQNVIQKEHNFAQPQPPKEENRTSARLAAKIAANKETQETPQNKKKKGKKGKLKQTKNRNAGSKANPPLTRASRKKKMKEEKFLDNEEEELEEEEEEDFIDEEEEEKGEEEEEEEEEEEDFIDEEEEEEEDDEEEEFMPTKNNRRNKKTSTKVNKKLIEEDEEYSRMNLRFTRSKSIKRREGEEEEEEFGEEDLEENGQTIRRSSRLRQKRGNQ